MIGLVVALLVGAPPDDDRSHHTAIRPGPAQPTPTAVIGKDELATRPDLATAVEGEPGLRVVRLGGLGAYATLSIRGSTPEQVLVVLDGIPINPADGAPVDLSSLPVGPLDAVALYRGRAPYGFGVDAIGGVLALRSRTTRSAAEASAGVGSFDTRLARGFVAGGGMALAVDYSGSAGDFRFMNDRGTAFTTDDDIVARRLNADFDQGSVLGKATIDLSDDAVLTLLDLFTASERGLPGLGIDPTVASRYASLRNLGGARLDARLGNVRLGALGFVGWSRNTVTDPADEIGLGSGGAEITSLVPGATVNVALPLRSGDWRWLPSIVTAWRYESTSGTAVAGADRHLVSTAAELGARSGAFEGNAAVRLELAPELEPAFRVELALNLDTLRASLTAHLSHRLPSLFELHGDSGTTLGRPDLRPETSLGGEAALRWQPLDALGLEAYVFASRVDDLIQLVQNAQNVVRPENVAAAELIGVELAAEYMNAHLRMRGSLAWLDARDRSDVTARAGKRLPLRPEWTASLRAELFTGDEDAQAGVWLELDHGGGNYLDFANLVKTPARTLLGAGAFVTRGPVRVDVTLANLLSEQVVDLAGYPLPGLTALVMLRVGR